MCKEESEKKEISGAYLTGERPLFGGKNLSIQDTIFTDGESLKGGQRYRPEKQHVPVEISPLVREKHHRRGLHLV